MSRTCACNCGASLAGMRADAVYASEACSKRARRSASPDKARTEHPLREVRGQQEEGASADYLLLAREQICRTLLATGFFTADDLEPLGIPREYRRSVHGSATGYFSGEEPFMEEVGRRKSERPERKGGKNTVFRITAKGRRELRGLLRGMEGPAEDARKRLYGQELTAGVSAVGHLRVSRGGGAGIRPSPAHSTDPGEQSAAPTGVPTSQESGSDTNPAVPSASDKTGESPAVTSHAAGDSARQLQGGRDRQVRSAGSPSPGPKMMAEAANATRRTAATQPARLFELPPERPGHDRIGEAA